MARDKILRMAIQRSGRLAEGSQSLLAQCGVKAMAAKHQLIVQDTDFGMEFIFARDDDIPGLVEKGACDLGIVGSNLMDEYRAQSNGESEQLKTVMPLGFAQCRLSLAFPKSQQYLDVNDLAGKTIATSYPNTVKKFLNINRIEAEIVIMSGSVELAPHMGMADLICDLVSTGATLKANGLNEWIKLSQSEAILISNPSFMNVNKQIRLNRLLLRINGALKRELI